MKSKRDIKYLQKHYYLYLDFPETTNGKFPPEISLFIEVLKMVSEFSADGHVRFKASTELERYGF